MQSTNQSKILQLKNELHHLSMKNKTITQCLFEIKSKCDAIAIFDSLLSAKNIILYSLNEVYSSY